MSSNSDDSFASFVFGLVVGIILAVFVAVMTSANSDKLRECEKDLPRTEKCKLIAVPAQEQSK